MSQIDQQIAMPYSVPYPPSGFNPRIPPFPGLPSMPKGRYGQPIPAPVVPVPSQVALPAIGSPYGYPGHSYSNRGHSEHSDSCSRRYGQARCRACPPCNCRTCTPSKYSYCSPCHKRCSCEDGNDYDYDEEHNDNHNYDQPMSPIMGAAPPPVVVMPMPPPVLVRRGIRRRHRRKKHSSEDSRSDTDSDTNSYTDTDMDTDRSTDSDGDTDNESSYERRRWKRRRKWGKKRSRRMMPNDRAVKPILSYVTDGGRVKFSTKISNSDAAKLVNGWNVKPEKTNIFVGPTDHHDNSANTRRKIVLRQGSLSENLNEGKKELIFNPSNKKISNLSVSFQLI